MYFEKYGSGENVFVGFHGWSGDHRTFHPILKYLPDNITFYSADLPGIGKSPAPKEWTIQHLVIEISQGLTSLKAPSVSIIGSCSGGLLALFVAKYLLESGMNTIIKRLVLIDPYAFFPWYFSVFVSPKMGKIGWYAYYTTFANPIGRWMTNLSLSNHRNEGVDLTESFSDVDHRTTYKYLQLLFEGGESEQFRQITIPVDIVYGENTFKAVFESVRQWKTILPIVTCHQLNKAGHLPIIETPKELIAVMLQTS